MRCLRCYHFKYAVVAVTISVGLLIAIMKMLANSTSPESVYKYGAVNGRGMLGSLYSQQVTVNYSKDKVIVPNYPQLSEQDLLGDLQIISQKIEKCFQATNLRLFNGLSILAAMRSASSYVSEYRKVIPMTFQADFTSPSHCWKMSYEAHTNDARHIWGHIGNVTFDEVIPNDYRSSLLRDVQNTFHNHFTSQTICLPNLFLLGFPKCGSTFLWCLIERVINTTVKVTVASFKEPGWWYERNDSTMKKVNASEFGRYIVNFATPIRAVDTCGQMNVVLADATPGMAYASPRFHEKEHIRLNYCLLPSAIPHFLPHARFIMIMREPTDALYSLFWWACKGRLNDKTRKIVPNAFHKGVMLKIDTFNKCMRNENIEEIRRACSISAPNYSLCITHPQRLTLLDKCVEKMSTTDLNTEKIGMPNCAKFGFDMYMYFVHVRRWLSVTPREKFYFLTLNDTSDPITVARTFLRLLDISLPSDFDEVVNQAYSVCQRRKNKQKISYSESASLQMRDDTRKYLDKFFAPFNMMLAEILNDSKFLFT